MKTLNAIKLKIMVRAFSIRIKSGEDFDDIAADYPALTTDDLEEIRESLNLYEITEEEAEKIISEKELDLLRGEEVQNE